MSMFSIKRHTGCGSSLAESVEIHHHHVDGCDAVLGYSGNVLRILAAMQDSAVDLGMQGLDSAVEHLGESGELGDVFDRHSGVAQQLGGTACGDQLDAEGGKFPSEIDHSSFVGYAENGAVNFGHEAWFLRDQKEIRRRF